ncbi:MAG: glycosyltransferase family 4 protein [Flavobacteriaceae bacterium]|jgi:GalNAc-alpha-(1->4)-GalNAc-alpha-(1->3)-diNAcBac-PP-undecaprenol alpha-1,4-N-acetyl-D-galactosaminyltransferase|uniref:glycosyltransferase family 4 protein n=1 Tax=Flagellimonas sp. SN16 TaxID=3415142 RepID=UPI0025EB7394|nr:glycosyltransferase family 4 protein [Allomuricauda sp.]MCR9263391.1 glycosyltransferase family 4 protein [Flavobacteriaceae bacterium]
MDTKKRIAFVISKLSSGGAQRVIATLANNLVSKFDITIITYSNQESFYELDEKINVIPCFEKDHIESSKNALQSIRLNYRLYRSIKNILKEEGIDLVIGFITQSNIFSVFAAKKNKVPCIICERTNPERAKIQKFWKILRHVAYPKADCLVVQTNFAKDFYLKNIPESNIKILPNPINPKLSNKRTAEQKENIVLAVGRLHKLKNHAMAITSFANVNPQDWKLLILGEGAERSNLEKLAANVQNVELLGAKTNIETYYNKAKIFLFTSYYEGFPNALLEAMHFGAAPISTDCKSGPSEIIEDGINGYLVKINDDRAMTKHLSQLIDDSNLRNSMGKAAQKTTERYSSENVTRLWYDLIISKLN